MRIIAGTHRGRSYLGPEDDSTTRPVTDRVKEALFSRLMSLGVLGYGTVVDIFSGTGSMGLEALSRGADRCLFVERDREALCRLDENLDTLGFRDRAQVKAGDALSPLWVRLLKDGSLTVAWVDPPYALMVPDEPAMSPPGIDTNDPAQADDEAEPASRPAARHRGRTPTARQKQVHNPDAVYALIASLLPKLEPGGVILLRTPEGCDPRELPGFDGPASVAYGSMSLHFYQRPMPQDAPA
jgi:16S rRNA G966 N2-methylase RsmD